VALGVGHGAGTRAGLHRRPELTLSMPRAASNTENQENTRANFERRAAAEKNRDDGKLARVSQQQAGSAQVDRERIHDRPAKALHEN